jgi:hypothetical protein
MGENPYFVENPSSSSGMSEISTDNNLFTESGMSPTHSITESNHEMPIDKNFDMNDNYGATMVPSSQISMVVKCDEDGKISVLPVTLHCVNGTRRFSCIDGELDSAVNEPDHSAMSNNHDFKTHPEPSNDCYPTHTSISMSNGTTTHGSDLYSTNQGPTHAVNSPTAEHHPHTIHYHPTSSPSYQYRSAIKKRSLPTAVITNTALASNYPASNESLPSPGNQITTSDSSSYYTKTMSNPNSPNSHYQSDHRLSTNQQSMPSSCIVVNGEYTNYHKSQTHAIATSRHSHSPPLTDANNNMVNGDEFVTNKHSPVIYTSVNEAGFRYLPTSDGPNCMDDFDNISGTVVVDANNNHFYYESNIVYGEPMKYDVHPVSPPHILLPSSMARRPSTIMEPLSRQSCLVKVEPEDVKPVIGIDVPAFNHHY